MLPYRIVNVRLRADRHELDFREHFQLRICISHGYDPMSHILSRFRIIWKAELVQYFRQHIRSLCASTHIDTSRRPVFRQELDNMPPDRLETLD